MAPVISRSGWSARPSFVGVSHDGKLVVAAGRRDEPVKFQDGIVAFYDAESGRTVREVPQEQIRWAALAADDRMVVVATSHGGYGDSRFIGIDVATGQPRWANPPVGQRGGFYPLAGIGFEAKSPWFKVALRDGDSDSLQLAYRPRTAPFSGRMADRGPAEGPNAPRALHVARHAQR